MEKFLFLQSVSIVTFEQLNVGWGWITKWNQQTHVTFNLHTVWKIKSYDKLIILGYQILVKTNQWQLENHKT